MPNKKADLGIEDFMNRHEKNKSPKKVNYSNLNELENTPNVESVQKNTVVRNVYMTEEIFFRLELLKKIENGKRKKGEPFIRLSGLMRNILEMYLDKNYPDTKELYKLMNEQKLE